MSYTLISSDKDVWITGESRKDEGLYSSEPIGKVLLGVVRILNKLPFPNTLPTTSLQCLWHWCAGDRLYFYIVEVHKRRNYIIHIQT